MEMELWREYCEALVSCSGSMGGGLARGDSGLSMAMSSVSMMQVRLENVTSGQGRKMEITQRESKGQQAVGGGLAGVHTRWIALGGRRGNDLVVVAGRNERWWKSLTARGCVAAGENAPRSSQDGRCSGGTASADTSYTGAMEWKGSAHIARVEREGRRQGRRRGWKSALACSEHLRPIVSAP